MKGLPIWQILLAVWMILYGAINVFELSFSNMNVVMGLLALITGIMIFVRK